MTLLIIILCIIIWRLSVDNNKKYAEIEILKTKPKEAVNKSRAVLKGKISEQIAPFGSDFPFAASDCRFIGSPIDFLIIQGMSDESDEVNIYICDIKTGSSQLSKIQRKIRNAIRDNRVYFFEHRINIEDTYEQEQTNQSEEG